MRLRPDARIILWLAMLYGAGYAVFVLVKPLFEL